jgi:hypothetical protein
MAFFRLALKDAEKLSEKIIAAYHAELPFAIGF